MKRKWIRGVFAVLMLAFCFVISGCGACTACAVGCGACYFLIHSDGIMDTGHLGYTLNEDGQSYSVYWTDFAYAPARREVVIPAEYRGLPVTKIADCGFYPVAFANGRSGIVKITLPDTIVEIGEEAFAQGEFEEIKLPDSIVKIGADAFRSSQLKTIDLPDKLESLGAGAFSFCDNLKEIEFPASLKVIQDETLEGTAVETVVIPEGVEEIQEEVFSYCDNLKELHLSSTVKSFGNFGDDSSIERISVAENNPYFKSIDGNVYSKDGTKFIQYAAGKTETTFELPSEVTMIQRKAFKYSTLESIVFPENSRLTEVEASAFVGCRNLQMMVFPDTLQKISISAISSLDWSGLAEYENFYYVSTVSNKYFAPVGQIETVSESLTFHSQTKYVPANLAIKGAPTEILIPEGVTEIGANLIGYCPSLQRVTIPKTVAKIDKIAFYAGNVGCKFEVDPENEAYKSVDGVLYTKDGQKVL
ncbi:MAG: leucine-rich repeat domain-containing protein [Clostridia bacterium]|nr:leucine-rich repeat domain-containing protein [Clostridia bacterium]